MRISLPRTLMSTLAAAVTTASTARAQQWVPQHPATTASLRGLSPVNDSVAWASGTGGTFLWTANGGTDWQVGMVPGATSLDFRAVHAVSLDTAYLMAAGQDTARIYYTTDRGAHWTAQYDSVGKGLFFDAIAFFDRTHALVLGDPMGGHFTLVRTDDGTHWTRLAPTTTPDALPGEAAFAASGTALVTVGPRHAWFATGGAKVSRVFRTTDGGEHWSVSETPIVAGSASRGIFSLTFTDTLHGVAVGGDYSSPDSTAVAAAFTNDGGVTWTAVPPSKATGYLSGVAVVPGSRGLSFVGVGTPGTSASTDGGHTWRLFAAQPFNSVMAASFGTVVWAVGERGAVARLTGPLTGAVQGR